MPRFSDPERGLGGKIGPRLVDLAVRATLATRRGLAPHEARVRQAATQALIDRAGHEVADHYRPLLESLLAGEHGPIHPDMHAYLGRTAAGTHQWQSLSALLGGGLQSALSNAIGNAVAPVSYAINRAGPNLNADPGTWAAGVAAGWADFATGQGVAHDNGLGGGNFQMMVDLASQIPGPDQLAQLVNRGVISEEEALTWLHHAAVPASLRGAIMDLRHQLLSPADAALAVLRGNISEGEGRSIAGRNGYTAAQFDIILNNTGEPLGLEQLLQARRRGFIGDATLKRGILQSRVRDEWVATAEKLAYSPMPTADAADAALRGHLTEAQARTIAEENGLIADQWPAYFANQGNPPAPEQLLELLRRGYIGLERAQLGLREGRTRDEWIASVIDLQYEPLSTADAIDAWLRGHLSKEQAEQLARENGLLPRDIPAALANAGSPLALEQLLEAERRGFITESRLEQGLKEGRLRDDWIPTAKQLRNSPMSTADAVDAAIQNWLTEDQARKIAEENGLEPGQFGILLKTAGSPLSRTELTELVQRGKISRARMEQGLRESRIKDSWIPDAMQLVDRLPQEFQVAALIKAGVIDHARAIALMMDLGYSRQTAAELVLQAETEATGEHRRLAQGQVSQLYASHIIDRATAAGMMEALHYTAASAQLVLDLADHTRRMRILDTGITAIRSQYLAHRVTDLEAAADLVALEIPSDARDLYLKVWGIERQAVTKRLTEAQVYKAFTKAMFDPRDTKKNREIACQRLMQLGYSEADATLLLDGA